MLVFWGWSDVAQMTEAMTEARTPLTIRRHASKQRFDPAIVERERHG
jgi:hypothetical protein